MAKKQFAAIALDPKYKIYVIHVGSVNFVVSSSSFPLNADIHPFHRPQISGLIAKKALTKIPAKYLDFADIFSPELVSKLFRHIRINNYAIKVVDSKQPLYGPIYSLEPVELETLKAYIKTNLANKFIKLFKSLAGTPILFDRKSDCFFRLYIDYQSFNNLTIKNQYPLPLIEKSLNRLKRARQFTQFNFTSAYH